MIHMDPLQARSAAHLSWSATSDRRARTAPAREARDRRFVERARELLGPGATDEQVEQSAQSLRKAFFVDLARRSVVARMKKR